ncbi:4-hydroxy-tetrahydrodipicolinate synthase [Paenibacillus sp. MWE-103]|uniref:4-hydroxy-tetrahydrodipicolinate synthase n=1 Tax=Paenibacillus artemisiicola TaxID=1172618 RepID=A0ABS3WDG3_9BACL|nr:4-hydroxy-tetrahydrodipicolinate synthase [Paenibacillus artemisiicola]MBO7746308.1 4-hydroxy-tetrahydrodipicolinate synthase [Paenibacillus artemisiicola]
MLTEQQLHGIFVPVVTPFAADGALDQASYDRYLGALLARDIQGLVVNGTTGESPTVAWSEVESLVRWTKAAMARHGKTVPIIVGTGTNDTRSTLERTARAGELGADAALVVVPYYSRPSQAGIVAHFRRAAEAGLPIVVYEIPARTGVRLGEETAAEILALDGVVGMKDSSGGMELLEAMIRRGVRKPILCGEDALFPAMLRQGAAGGILASANVRTDAFARVYRRFREGDASGAERAFEALAPLVRLLFADANPAPLKWLLARQGRFDSGALRLPLLPIAEELQRELEEALGRLGQEQSG